MIAMTTDRNEAAEIVLQEFDRSILVARVIALEKAADFGESLITDLAEMLSAGAPEYAARLHASVQIMRKLRRGEEVGAKLVEQSLGKSRAH